MSIALASIATPISANAYWSVTNYGVVVSNVCRSGPYYQYVNMAPVGNFCYLPAFGLYGTMVQE